MWNLISLVWNWISLVWNLISYVWNWISFVRNRPENGIEPSLGGVQRGEDDRDRPWFSPISVKTIIFIIFFFKASSGSYVKDVSLTEPSLMGGPKGMGAEV